MVHMVRLWPLVSQAQVQQRVCSGANARSFNSEHGGRLAVGARDASMPGIGGPMDPQVLGDCGALPGETPFERGTKSELVLSLRMAQALGLSIPARVRVSADAVIE
jgi:hypothetical protein